MAAGPDADPPHPEPKANPERRCLSRRALWEYAIATPVAGGIPPFEVRITDASDNGIGFRSPRALGAGQELTLSLLKLDLNASVVRCRVVRCTPAGDAFSVGAAIL